MCQVELMEHDTTQLEDVVVPGIHELLRRYSEKQNQLFQRIKEELLRVGHWNITAEVVVYQGWNPTLEPCRIYLGHPSQPCMLCQT